MNSVDENNQPKDQFRVVVDREANDCLDGLIKHVNENWDAGRVTKPQLVSWALRRLAERFAEKDLAEIRACHFDKIAYLESLLKKAKQTGEVPEELALAFPNPISAGKKTKASKP